MINALFLCGSEWSFVCLGVYLFLLLFIFIIFFVLEFNCFFSAIKIFFFVLRYVPLVIKAKRNTVGLFQGSLVEDGTMFVLSYFYTKHHRLQRAFETSIMQKFALKNFFK